MHLFIYIFIFVSICIDLFLFSILKQRFQACVFSSASIEVFCFPTVIYFMNTASRDWLQCCRFPHWMIACFSRSSTFCCVCLLITVQYASAILNIPVGWLSSFIQPFYINPPASVFNFCKLCIGIVRICPLSLQQLLFSDFSSWDVSNIERD